MDSIGYCPDDPGQLDNLTENLGLIKRKGVFGGGSMIELIGKLHLDFFNQPKFLLNNVDVRIVLSFEKPEFYCMEEETSTSFVEISDATLFMNHVTVNPGILLAQEEALNHSPAMYPYKRVECKSYTITSNNSSISLDNLIQGRLPSLILVAFVDNDSFVGKRSKNPFNFKHYKCNMFSLQVNGVSIPSQPLTFDYTKDKPLSSRGYSTVFRNSGIHYYNTGNLISKKAFDGGTFLLCFDLSSYQTASCSSLLDQGAVRMDARFSEPLPNTVTCLIYAEYDAVIEINKSREIRPIY